jgi:AmmeMemoRadiSam system protein A
MLFRERCTVIWDNPTEQAGELLDIEAIQPTEAQQRAMLVMARQAIAAALNRRPAPLAPDDPFLAYRAGVFVTLREKKRSRESGPGRLRGCIGHMQADQPLAELLPEMAVQAATGDPRFPPMKPEELKGVTIEIAILSPIRPVQSRDAIDIGKHGLVLTGEWRRALLLPKSPVIYGWDLDEYLASLHRKAGLPPDYWPERGKLYSFTSFDFGE